MKAKNIIKHPSELRRTLKAFFTFYKHLFGKESKENKTKFESKLETENIGTSKFNKGLVQSESAKKSTKPQVAQKEKAV